MRRVSGWGAVFFFLFFFAVLVPCQGRVRWFRSNASGMALLEETQGLAMREDYALSVEEITENGVPPVLRPWLESAWSLEMRVLWHRGGESRRLWVFRDAKGLTRLSAAFNSNPFDWPDAAPPAGAAPQVINYGGYIEVYNAQGYIIAEHRTDPDRNGRITDFFYSGNTLVRAETRIRQAPRPAASTEDSGPDAGSAAAPPAGAAPPAEAEPYCTDRYFYTRALSLRAVERRYHGSGAGEPQRLQFSHRLDQAAASIVFERPQIAVSVGYNEAAAVPSPEAGSVVLYQTDSQGRVLSETRRNGEGEVTGEILNTWSGNRLESVFWHSGEDEQRTEYEYDASGDRIAERNYRNGILERVVRREGERDIEELYLDGQVMLRAVWEGGRKIAEERFRGGGR